MGVLAGSFLGCSGYVASESCLWLVIWLVEAVQELGWDGVKDWTNPERPTWEFTAVQGESVPFSSLLARMSFRLRCPWYPFSSSSDSFHRDSFVVASFFIDLAQCLVRPQAGNLRFHGDIAVLG